MGAWSQICFRSQGTTDKAEQYWAQARSLNPDSINFFRHDLTLSAEGSAGDSFMSFVKDYVGQGKDSYRPLDLEEK